MLSRFVFLRHSAVAFLSGVAVASFFLSPSPAAQAKGGGLKATVIAKAKACTKAPPSKAAEIRLLAEGQKAFLGELSMKANGSVPEHRDATEEYIHVLEGGGRMFIDDQPHTIGPGDTVFMPANAKVRFENGPKPLRALQVFAGPAPAKKYDAWGGNAACR